MPCNMTRIPSTQARGKKPAEVRIHNRNSETGTDERDMFQNMSASISTLVIDPIHTQQP